MLIISCVFALNNLFNWVVFSFSNMSPLVEHPFYESKPWAFCLNSIFFQNPFSRCTLDGIWVWVVWALWRERELWSNVSWDQIEPKAKLLSFCLNFLSSPLFFFFHSYINVQQHIWFSEYISIIHGKLYVPSWASCKLFVDSSDLKWLHCGTIMMITLDSAACGQRLELCHTEVLDTPSKLWNCGED